MIKTLHAMVNATHNIFFAAATALSDVGIVGHVHARHGLD
jgi:hypothetical protein